MSETPAPAPGFHAAPSDKMGWPGQVSITLQVNLTDLTRLTDTHLAALWHAAQAAPAEYGDKVAGELVRKLTFEIVRRWLGKTPAELYRHQGDAPGNALRSALARYRPGGADDRDGTWHDGAWTLKGAVIDAVLAGPPPGTVCPYCGTDGPATVALGTGLTVAPGKPDPLDRGAAGLARVEHGPGAGEVWICRDSDACRTRVWRAAEADDSLVCARCNRTPGAAAAPTDLARRDTDDGPRWFCTDTAQCDRRVAAGASPPYRFDKAAQARVAAHRAQLDSADAATEPGS